MACSPYFTLLADMFARRVASRLLLLLRDDVWVLAGGALARGCCVVCLQAWGTPPFIEVREGSPAHSSSLSSGFTWLHKTGGCFFFLIKDNLYLLCVSFCRPRCIHEHLLSTESCSSQKYVIHRILFWTYPSCIWAYIFTRQYNFTWAFINFLLGLIRLTTPG